MHRNKAIVAITKRMLVSIWYILAKREPYRHLDEETIAYKMLVWAQAIGEVGRQGLTRQLFAKYGICVLEDWTGPGAHSERWRP